jgi:hypothetical protein
MVIESLCRSPNEAFNVGISVLNNTAIMYPPSVSCHLFLLLTLWSWWYEPTIAVCTAMVWITSMGNHFHRSRHCFWWWMDFIVVQLSAGGHFVHGMCVIPFFPYMLVEAIIIIAAVWVFIRVALTCQTGWWQSAVHLLVFVTVVVHTLALSWF